MQVEHKENDLLTVSIQKDKREIQFDVDFNGQKNTTDLSAGEQIEVAREANFELRTLIDWDRDIDLKELCAAYARILLKK